MSCSSLLACQGNRVMERRIHLFKSSLLHLGDTLEKGVYLDNVSAFRTRLNVFKLPVTTLTNRGYCY